jgi:hypothetical protein
MNALNFVVNNWDAVALIAGTLYGLVHHTNKKQTASDRWDVLLALGRQLVPKLLADARLYDDQYVRSKLRQYMIDGLTRLKVPMTPKISDLVDEAVEHIHGELAEKLTEYHLGEFIKVQGKTAEILATGAAQ